MILLLLLALQGGGWCQENSCLCVTNEGNITVRETACGTSYKEHSVGACFHSTGLTEECLVDGVLQEFIQIDYGAGRLYWVLNVNLAEDEDGFKCAGNGGNCDNIRFVSRAEWGAREPVNQTPIQSPLSGVFVHHSAMTHCYNDNDCVLAVQEIQNLHMDTNGWDDIGYHFLVGEDGRVYEGRAWNNRGAHARQHNAWSYGVCMMGNFMDTMPNEIAIQAVKDIMHCGVLQGHVTTGFEVFGHRDGVCTACPGDTFYPEVQTWPYYSHRDIPVYC